MADDRLCLPEELLLLGWDDERGRNRGTQNLGFLVAGAAILDLTLREAVTIVDDRLRAGDEPTGDPTLDAVLEEIRASRKPRTVKGWVQQLGHRSWLRDGVVDHLVARGVLGRERHRVLGLFPTTRHPTTDPGRAVAVRERVARALTLPEPVSDPRDAALGGLVHSAGGSLLRRLVMADQRHAARDRAKALSKGEAMTTDIAAAIGEANAAAMAAVTAATVAATSASSSSSS